MALRQADIIIRCTVGVLSSLRCAIRGVAGRKNVVEHHWRVRGHAIQNPLVGQDSEMSLSHVFRRNLVAVGEQNELIAEVQAVGWVASPEIAVQR